MELKILFLMLWRRKWFVTAVFMAFFLPFLAGAFLLPKVYEATATMYVTPSEVRSMLFAGLGMQASTDSTDSETRISLVLARPVLDEVIRHLQLRDRHGALMTAADILKSRFLVSYFYPEPYFEAEVVQDTELIEIAAKSSDRDEAVMMADTLAEVFRARAVKERIDEYRQARGFVLGKLEFFEKGYMDDVGWIRSFRMSDSAVGLADDFASPLIGAKESSTVESLKQTLLDLQAQLAETLVFKTLEHPEVVALRQRLRATRIELAREIELNDSSMKVMFSVRQSMYSTLLGLLQQIDMAESLVFSDIRIVEPAALPPLKSPDRPSKALFMIIGLLLGGFFAAAGAFVLEYVDDSVRKGSDRASKSCFVGIVPGNGLRRPCLIDRFRPRPALVESYRRMRNAVFREWDHKLAIVAGVERSDPSELTAINIAVSLARAELRTLLIDADFAVARCHRLFRMKRVPGFSDVLRGVATLEQAVAGSGINGLSVLCAGAKENKASGLIDLPAAGDLLRRLRNEYDAVVVNASCISGSDDAAVMSGLADAVILTAREGRTGRCEFEKCVADLEARKRDECSVVRVLHLF